MWWWYNNSYNNLGVPKVWCYQTRRLISAEHIGTTEKAKPSQVPKSKQSKPVLLLWKLYFIFLNPLIVFCLFLSLFTTVRPNHFVLHINKGACSNQSRQKQKAKLNNNKTPLHIPTGLYIEVPDILILILRFALHSQVPVSSCEVGCSRASESNSLPSVESHSLLRPVCASPALVPSGAARRCLGHSHSSGDARVGVWGVCLSFYQSSHSVFPALFPASVFLEVTSSPLLSFPMVSLILLFDLPPCSYVRLCIILSFSNNLGALNFWTFRTNFHLLIAHLSSANFLVISGSHCFVLRNIYFWTVGFFSFSSF